MSAIDLQETDTVREAVLKLARAFTAAGIESADIDARYLVQGVAGVDAAEILKNPERRLGEVAIKLAGAGERRLKHEPVSRILGERMFYGRAFKVTPAVLDPRPETETLIDAALELTESRGWRDRPLMIADIGTGSGAILITLLRELPTAHGLATDVSAEALRVAEENARRHGVADRIKFVNGRGLAGSSIPADLVLSNPPYISNADIAGLDPEVRLYDPHLALDGGPDGLQIYLEIVREIIGLRRSVDVILEVGAGQAADVQALFRNALPPKAILSTSTQNDLAGHVRCVTNHVQF